MKKHAYITSALAVALGLIAVQEHHRRVHYARPKALLKQLKQDFLRDGPIAGAWIENDPKPYWVHHHEITAYYGGVTRETETGLVQYTVVVSPRGTILETKVIN